MSCLVAVLLTRATRHEALQTYKQANFFFTTMASVKRKASKSSKSSSSKTKKRVTARDVARIAKKVVLKTAETKYTKAAYEDLQLFHNTPTAVFLNMLYTPQGVTEESRVGDKIQAKGLQAKFYFESKPDRPNCTFRIIFYTSPPDQVSSGSPSAFFENDIGNKLLDKVNTNKYRIVKQKFIQMKGQDTTWNINDVKKNISKTVEMYIPFKGRTVTYSSESGGTPKYQRDCISCIVIAYDAYGTLVTDNIASVGFYSRFYFKDI